MSDKIPNQEEFETKVREILRFYPFQLQQDGNGFVSVSFNANEIAGKIAEIAREMYFSQEQEMSFAGDDMFFYDHVEKKIVNINRWQFDSLGPLFIQKHLLKVDAWADAFARYINAGFSNIKAYKMTAYKSFYELRGGIDLENTVDHYVLTNFKQVEPWTIQKDHFRNAPEEEALEFVPQCGPHEELLKEYLNDYKPLKAISRVAMLTYDEAAYKLTRRTSLGRII